MQNFKIKRDVVSSDLMFRLKVSFYNTSNQSSINQRGYTITNNTSNQTFTISALSVTNITYPSSSTYFMMSPGQSEVSFSMSVTDDTVNNPNETISFEMVGLNSTNSLVSVNQVSSPSQSKFDIISYLIQDDNDTTPVTINPPETVTDGYRGGTLLPSGKIVFNPYRATKVATYDPALNNFQSVNTISFDGGVYGTSSYSILTSTGYVMLARLSGLESNTNQIPYFIRYNPTDNTVSAVYGITNVSQGRFLFESDANPGRVYLVNNVGNVYKVNSPYTTTPTLISGTTNVISSTGSIKITTNKWLLAPDNTNNFYMFNDTTETATLVTNNSSITSSILCENAVKLSNGYILLPVRFNNGFVNRPPILYNPTNNTLTDAGFTFNAISRCLAVTSGTNVIRAPHLANDDKFQIVDAMGINSPVNLYTQPSSELYNAANNIAFDGSVTSNHWIVFVPFNSKYFYQYDTNTNKLYRTILSSNSSKYYEGVKMTNSLTDNRIVMIPSNGDIIIYDPDTVSKIQVA